MKLVFFSRPQVTLPPAEAAQLLDVAEAHGAEYVINEEFAATLEQLTGRRIPASRRYASLEGEQLPAGSVMVCFGGDGTLLEGVRCMGLREVPIIGMNYGRLGFLSTMPRGDVEEALERIVRGEFTTEARTLLAVEGDFCPAPEFPFVFNEVTVQRKGSSMVAVEALIDGAPVATYHGDGVIVATPNGSTAYSLSVGGPVVVPECRCMVISPIAPHNLTMRPVVIPDSCEVELRIASRGHDVTVSLDNMTCRAGDGAVLKIRKAARQVFLGRLQNISFYDTLRDKMMWGVDMRDDK